MSEWIGVAKNRLLDRIRHRAARSGTTPPSRQSDFSTLRSHKYCLLVSFRRSGEAVATPVWFALDGDDRAYVRSDRAAEKLKRVNANPRVLVAPCTARGKPLGAPIEATARLLSVEQRDRAEGALESRYGIGRQLYDRGARLTGIEAAYLEIVARRREDER